MKILSSILIASLLAIGALAVMPAEQAFAGHITTATSLGSGTTGVDITAGGVISDIDGAVAITDVSGINLLSAGGDIDVATTGADASVQIDSGTDGISIRSGGAAAEPTDGQLLLQSATGTLITATTVGVVATGDVDVAATGADVSVQIDSGTDGISIAAGAAAAEPTDGELLLVGNTNLQLGTLGTHFLSLRAALISFDLPNTTTAALGCDTASGVGTTIATTDVVIATPNASLGTELTPVRTFAATGSGEITVCAILTGQTAVDAAAGNWNVIVIDLA